MTEETVTKKLRIDYRDLRKWLGCPECNSQKAKVEKGSLQLFCPNCKNRQDLLVEESQEEGDLDG